MLQQHEIKKIESLKVEYHDIFARHRFDIGMNEEFTVKLVELALLHKYGIINMAIL